MRTRLAAVAGALTLPIALVVPTTAAQAAPSAAQEYVACTWQVGQRDQTLACGAAFSKQGEAVFSQCWRFRPSPASVVRRAGSEWVRTPLRVRVFPQAKFCRTTVPWRSMVSVPVTGKHPGKASTYQIQLPATDKYRRTTLTFGVCVVTVGTTTPCS